MATNDPVLEVLREIRSDLVATHTEIRQLVRHAEHTNLRLDEQGDILREHSLLLREHSDILRDHGGTLRQHGETSRLIDSRLQNLEHTVEDLQRQGSATVAVLQLLHAGVQSLAPMMDLGRLRDDRLDSRVEDCERRLDAIEQGEDG